MRRDSLITTIVYLLLYSFICIIGTYPAYALSYSRDSIISTNVENIRGDSIAQDTSRRTKLYQNYTQLNTFFKVTYYHHPYTFDSVFSRGSVFPFHIISADCSNMFELLKNQLYYVSVPYTLSSSKNKTLYFGFPSMNFVSNDDGYSMQSFSEFDLSFTVIPAILQMDFVQAGYSKMQLQPTFQVKPETHFLWESGVFKENSFCLRFVRPLTRNLSIGVFRQDQTFNHVSYDHSTGGMYGFYYSLYKFFGIDSTAISYKGIQPLTREQITTIRLSWNMHERIRASCSYSYADFGNEFGYTPKSSVLTNNLGYDTATVKLNTTNSFIHSIHAKYDYLAPDLRQGFRSRASLKSMVQGFLPSSKDLYSKRGTSVSTMGSAEHFWLMQESDTFFLSSQCFRQKTQRYDLSNYTGDVLSTRIGIASCVPYSLVQGRISLSGGIAGSSLYHTLRFSPLWDLSYTKTMNTHFLRMYHCQTIDNRAIIFDTAVQVVPDFFVKPYMLSGFESLVRFHSAGIAFGGNVYHAAKDSIVPEQWQNNMLPYRQPRWSVCVAPLFTHSTYISCLSQWIFSDTKPFVKSKNILGFKIHNSNQSAQWFIDFGFDYWSDRQTTPLSGALVQWKRSIYDVNLKIAVEIKTFRLFYKVDNILNREIVYVPGNSMPGLTFRFGFSWLIQG